MMEGLIIILQVALMTMHMAIRYVLTHPLQLSTYLNDIHILGLPVESSTPLFSLFPLPPEKQFYWTHETTVPK